MSNIDLLKRVPAKYICYFWRLYYPYLAISDTVAVMKYLTKALCKFTCSSRQQNFPLNADYFLYSSEVCWKYSTLKDQQRQILHLSTDCPDHTKIARLSLSTPTRKQKHFTCENGENPAVLPSSLKDDSGNFHCRVVWQRKQLVFVWI